MNVDDILAAVRSLSEDEKRKVFMELMPGMCKSTSPDNFMKTMMHQCADMMGGQGFPSFMASMFWGKEGKA